MAYQNVDTGAGFVAGADLSALKHTFVKMGTVDGTVVSCGAGEAAVGVLMEGCLSGQAAAVAVGRQPKVKAGEAIERGDKIASGAAGVAVVAETGDYVLGVAQTSGASGEVITLNLQFQGVDTDTIA
jgi:hypothetical protein